MSGANVILKEKSVLSGIMGHCVADAIGVPVEFQSRNNLKRHPVDSMRAFGTHGQPVGTWSDDTSMTLCLLDGIVHSLMNQRSKNLDYNKIMKNFADWLESGEFTPHGEVFDIGRATRNAIYRFQKGSSPLVCGGTNVSDNGNGSLMRILPVSYYLHSIYGENITSYNEAMEIIHSLSSLTHAHKRSLIACGIYVTIACKLLSGLDKHSAIINGITEASDYYFRIEKEHNLDLSGELVHFKRVFQPDELFQARVDSIKSSGYVIDTLEAAIWCFYNSREYKDCVLTAVNLGEDTDTVAAVAGGLAGLYYGYDSIPEEWVQAIVKREVIEELCHRLENSLKIKLI